MKKNVVKSKVAKVLATGCSMAFVLGAMPAVNAQSCNTNDYSVLTVQDEQSHQAMDAAIKVMEAAKLGLIKDYEAVETLKNEQIKMAKENAEKNAKTVKYSLKSAEAQRASELQRIREFSAEYNAANEKGFAAAGGYAKNSIETVTPVSRTGLDEAYAAIDDLMESQIEAAKKSAEKAAETKKAEDARNEEIAKYEAEGALKNKHVKDAVDAADTEETATVTGRTGLDEAYAKEEAMKNAKIQAEKDAAEKAFEAQQNAKKAEAAKINAESKKGLADDMAAAEAEKNAKIQAEKDAAEKNAKRQAEIDKYEAEGALKNKHVQDKVDEANTTVEDTTEGTSFNPYETRANALKDDQAMRASEDARAIHGEGRINPYAAREAALRESEVERNSDISREINAEAAMNGHVETAAEEATKNAYETRLDAMKVDEAENTKANEAMKAVEEAKAAAAQAKAAAEEANNIASFN